MHTTSCGASCSYFVVYTNTIFLCLNDNPNDYCGQGSSLLQHSFVIIPFPVHDINDAAVGCYLTISIVSDLPVVCRLY